MAGQMKAVIIHDAAICAVAVATNGKYVTSAAASAAGVPMALPAVEPSAKPAIAFYSQNNSGFY